MSAVRTQLTSAFQQLFGLEGGSFVKLLSSEIQPFLGDDSILTLNNHMMVSK